MFCDAVDVLYLCLIMKSGESSSCKMTHITQSDDFLINEINYVYRIFLSFCHKIQKTS